MVFLVEDFFADMFEPLHEFAPGSQVKRLSGQGIPKIKTHL